MISSPRARETPSSHVPQSEELTVCLAQAFAQEGVFGAVEFGVGVDQRDRVAARIPPGELVFANRHLSKLLEVPQEGLPRYRLRTYEFHQRLLDGALEAAAQEPSYLVHLRRRVGESDPPAWAALLERVPSEVVFEDERLVIRRATPRRSE